MHLIFGHFITTSNKNAFAILCRITPNNFHAMKSIFGWCTLFKMTEGHVTTRPLAVKKIAVEYIFTD